MPHWDRNNCGLPRTASISASSYTQAGGNVPQATQIYLLMEFPIYTTMKYIKACSCLSLAKQNVSIFRSFQWLSNGDHYRIAKIFPKLSRLQSSYVVLAVRKPSSSFLLIECSHYKFDQKFSWYIPKSKTQLSSFPLFRYSRATAPKPHVLPLFL